MQAPAKLWRQCVSRETEDGSEGLVIQRRYLVKVDSFEGVEARSIGLLRSKDGCD